MFGSRRNRDFSYPWGSWFILERDGVRDEDGTKFPSIRHAFMTGRLSLPHCEEDETERLIAYLLEIARNPNQGYVAAIDLFEGNRSFSDFYCDWLIGLGMITDFSHALTEEGRSALHMLVATRPVEKGPLPVGDDEVAARPPGEGSAEREAWFAEVDALAERMPSRFVRRDVGGQPMIVATAEAMGGRMKLRRTLWGQPFGSAESRDLIYRWLAMRVHRWPDWVGEAWRGGQQGLTAKLLSLLAADLVDYTAGLNRPGSIQDG